MIMFELSGGRYAIPVKELDKIMKKNLSSIKYDGKEIPDVRKLVAYYPEIRFKNVSRTNDDGSIDIIIDSGVATEFHTGFLSKRFYKALRVKKEKGLIGLAKWKYVDMIQVEDKMVIGTFIHTLPIDEVEEILEAMIKVKVNYFG